jgi:Ca2+-binding RTX toxin-like protein
VYRSLAIVLALAALLVAVVAGVAWAANVIQCPNPDGTTPYCDGTDGNDVMKGTAKIDAMRAARGADIMYGYKGADRLYGSEGPDIGYGGPGDDELGSGCDGIPCGRDEYHGGPGADRIVGNPKSEKLFGGRGDDEIVDYWSNQLPGYDPSEHPDVIRCGPGYDVVYYDKGVEKVAGDCEELIPVRR